MGSDLIEREKIIKDLRKNLLVSASAGSGKTTILVERMVALVEEGKVDLSKIAALTFTKKAAGEFYERFYKKLQLRTKEGFDKEHDDKFSLLPNPTKEAIKRDKEALSHIDTCFFGTIDAFYQKILNEHPLEAGLSSSSSIIDDNELNTYLIHKFSNYLSSPNKDLNNKASEFASLIGASNFPLIMGDILAHTNLDLYQVPGNIDVLNSSLSPLLKTLKDGVITLINHEDYFRYITVKKTQSLKDRNKDSGNAWEYLKENFQMIKHLKDDDYKGIKRVGDKLNKLYINEDREGYLRHSSLIDDFFEIDKDGYSFTKKLSDIVNLIIIHKTVEFLRIVKEDIYNDLIKDGLLTFSIATDCLLKLLKDEKNNKVVIDQIRSKIDALLIDECQDTDIKQYEIFFRLTASDYNDRFEDLSIEGGKLYACGDRKQGIYHFRGADVSTYDHIKDIFEHNKNSGQPFDLVTLTDNYRSNEALKQYFNETFENVLYSQGYSPILNVNPNKDKHVFTYETNKEMDPSLVASLILKLCNENGFTYKDFMVITSSKKAIIDYAREFTKRLIPSYSEGMIDIQITELLNVVIALFKYISNKDDKISFIEVLTSSLFRFDPSRSIDLSIDYLSKINVFDNNHHWPSDLLEEIVANENIISSLGVVGIDVLAGFIHLLKEEENAGNISSFSDAIKYFTDLQTKEESIERLSLLANNINAVQIANVHKTKGLEKNVVILTRAEKANSSISVIKEDQYYLISFEKKFNDNGKMIVFTNPYKDVHPIDDYIEKEKEYGLGEDLRLLYVAATRAKQYLFIAQDPKRAGQNKWAPLISDKIGSFHINGEYEVKPKMVELKIAKKTLSPNKVKTYEIVVPSKQVEMKKYDEDYIYSSLSKEDALLFGTMVHKLLEFIIKRNDIMFDESICEYVSNMYNGSHLLDKLKEVRNKIYQGGYKQDSCPFDDILEISKSYKCYQETPFTYKDEDKIVTGNIDLIMENDDEIIIIDYKTDASKQDHDAQLNVYKKAIEKTNSSNKKVIKTYIYNIAK